jgi:superfamily II DNA helicase RecQ
VEAENEADALASKNALRSFGYSEWRDRQGDVIQSVLSGKDTVGILQTGAGKSACFLVPAKVHADREK